MNRKEMDFNDDKVVEQVYSCAKEVYGSGIAVPIEDWHPCGWEWIDFSDIDESDVDFDLKHYKFKCHNISNGFGSDEYEELTLKEILLKTKGKFAFEVNVNTIDWNKD